MKSSPITSAALLHAQLQSIPSRNRAVHLDDLNREAAIVSLPNARIGWRRFLGSSRLMPAEKKFEMDAPGLDFLNRCDDKTTVEDLIKIYRAKWSLSFFEARAIVLGFLKQMMDRNIVVLRLPKESAETLRGERASR